MKSIKTNMGSNMEEVSRLLKEERTAIDTCKADTSISSMASWFAKYGEPRRASGPTFERRPNRDNDKIVDPEGTRQVEFGERQRTVPCRGRHIAHVGRGNAQTLRLGSGIRGTRSETDML